jgi:hypothetical protein
MSKEGTLGKWKELTMPDKPHGRGLAFTCSRRDFFPALLQEIKVIRDSLKGQPGYRLSELRDLPDEQLAEMRPMVNPQYEILIEGEYVCCRPRGMDKVRRLFTMEPENLVTFNQFDGRHRLDEVGGQLAREMGWEADQGFAYAKALFVALAERLVCIPQDAHDPSP